MRQIGIYKMGGVILLVLGILLSALGRLKIFSHELIGIHLWRQTQTQWNIRNFYRHSFDIFNPRTAALNEDFDNVVLLEFPIMQWLIGGVHHISGGIDDIIITRVCLFTISIISVYGVYELLKLVYSSSMIAGIGSAFFCFYPLFYFYSINPIPDNFALCCTIWFFVFLLKFYQSGAHFHLAVSAFFVALAVLSKLPFVVAGAGVFVLLGKYYREKDYKRVTAVVIAYSMSLVPSIAWYARATTTWDKQGTLAGIFGRPYTLEYLGDILIYNFIYVFPFKVLGLSGLVLLLISCFIELKRDKKIISGTIEWIFMVSFIACTLYFIYELPSINKVHDYYLMPFLPYFIVASGIGIKKSYSTKYGKIGLFLLFGLSCLHAIVEVNKNWSIEKSYSNEDLLLNIDELRNAVPDHNDCIFLNDSSGCIFAYYMDQWGYMFDNDQLPTPWIHDMIDRGGVRYMYSTSRIVDESESVKPYIKEIIMQKGNIKVIQLQLPEI